MDREDIIELMKLMHISTEVWQMANTGRACPWAVRSELEEARTIRRILQKNNLVVEDVWPRSQPITDRFKTQGWKRL